MKYHNVERGSKRSSVALWKEWQHPLQSFLHAEKVRFYLENQMTRLMYELLFTIIFLISPPPHPLPLTMAQGE
jgi:hypothetical protein